MYLVLVNELAESVELLAPLTRVEVGYDLNRLAKNYCDRFAFMYESQSKAYALQELQQTAAAAKVLQIIADMMLAGPVSATDETEKRGKERSA